DGGTSHRDSGKPVKDGGKGPKDAGGGHVGDDDDDGVDSGDNGDDSGGDDASSGDDGGGPTACLPNATDNLGAWSNPPAGLKPSQVPQFVMLGFDDNAYADGINWVVDTLFANRKNADGSPARATFFLIGGAGTSQNDGVFNPAGGHQTEQQV